MIYLYGVAICFMCQILMYNYMEPFKSKITTRNSLLIIFTALLSLLSWYLIFVMVWNVISKPKRYMQEFYNYVIDRINSIEKE